MANFSGLIAPTGMNQYAQAFQSGMASGQKNLAKQQYAQKFKEITSEDSTGNEKLDAEIYQKTELRKQQQQFIQNAPPGTRVQSLAGLGSYYDPSADTTKNVLKSLTVDLGQKKDRDSKVETNTKWTTTQIETWASGQNKLVDDNPNLTEEQKKVAKENIQQVKGTALTNVSKNYTGYQLGSSSMENALATNQTLIPTAAYVDFMPSTTPTTQPARGVVTGGATKPTSKPQYEIGKTYAFKDKSGNTIHKTYTAKGWQ